MKKSRLLILVSHCIVAYYLSVLSPVAHAHLYTASGNIMTSNGITGFSTWSTGATNLTWVVNHADVMNPDGFIENNYTYTFDHPVANTYNFILEVHPNVLIGASAIFDVNSTLPNFELGSFSSGPSFTGIPDTITGIRFWGETGSTSETISFTSGAVPVWGDFFASDKNSTTGVWNLGFTEQDIDPLSFEEVNGSIDSHILVPGSGVYIPIPTAIWLFGSSLLWLIGISKRKKAV